MPGGSAGATPPRTTDLPDERSARRAVAAATAVASAGVLVAPVLRFRARRTTVDPRPGDAPSALVTDGLNDRTRNPMYVGMAGVLLAHALWWGRARTLAPLVGFAAWMDRVQIPDEEAALRARFLADFEAYATRVPRWLVTLR
ncbi:MAG: isoprenylcysteine carboxylmethyltransferase family protein [Actinobacteria bacterium]|nr:isoprenylcysteine carboxylmethyltransferase family protein [Actinomycetota bacterium]MBU2111316.1 isoprenylcysteine carboxylmethyltransferase family protein [Actinomycetota bacterium]